MLLHSNADTLAGGERAEKVQGQSGFARGQGGNRVHVVADHGADPDALGSTLLSSQQVRLPVNILKSSLKSFFNYATLFGLLAPP